MISDISSKQTTNTSVMSCAKQSSKAIQAEQTQSENDICQSSVDTVEIGTGTQSSSVYTKSNGKKVDTATIEKLKQQADKATEHLRSIVEKLILKQGKSGDGSAIDPSDVEQAKQSISEDGEFGVKAVSDRIVDFAKAISGNDKSKIDTLKAAIEKGFAEAGEAFNGSLPDISRQTHDEIMKKLDAWTNEDES